MYTYYTNYYILPSVGRTLNVNIPGVSDGLCQCNIFFDAIILHFAFIHLCGGISYCYQYVIFWCILFYPGWIWVRRFGDNNNNDTIFRFAEEEIQVYMLYTTALHCDSFGGRIMYIYAAYVCGGVRKSKHARGTEGREKDPRRILSAPLMCVAHGARNGF